ncbi:MAG: VCBS repeat-containing protein [Flavobacteriaceae bacterium]
MLRISLLFSISLLLLACDQKSEKESSFYTADTEGDLPLFERIESSASGISFSNAIQHDIATRENLFDYDYFYNGAGVGLEDLNNDGLLDVFFCGNQVPNKLYFNEGNFKFTDVSKQAGIEKGNGWSTGVSFADINGDGWMDIYVTQGGPFPPEKRKNLLFINQQDGTFSEAAETYGLADTGIGTQSAFFDYDRDGDLDCIVMNENELYGVDPINLYRILKENKDLLYHNSSHLYRNDNGTFTDVTKKAGIERPIFGLGLSVSDIDNDGWLDIYIASDYYIPDALFINDQKGGFTDRIKDFTRQISYYGMGLDIADINNDNLQDIFVLDMASSDHVRSKTLMASMSTGRFDYLVNKANFHYQYMYNSLQLNLGNNMYNNIAQLSETSNTDWSWAVLLSDFDLDQYKDILITNGYRRYALDNDLQRKVFEAQQKYRGQVPLDIKAQLYNQMPSEKLPNILYKNSGGLQFENVASSWGIGDLSFSNGAAIGDLDDDGDLDIIINNMDEEAFLYQNLAVEQKRGNFLKVHTEGALSESFAKVHIYYEDHQQMVETKRVRGYMSSVDTDAYFGLGNTEKIDSIRILWPDGKSEIRTQLAVNQRLTFNEKDAEPYQAPKTSVKPLFKASSDSYGLDFVHQENRYDDFEKEILLPYKQSGQGPFVTKGDLNGDGLNDIFIGGASGQAGALFINTGKSFKKKSSSALEYDSAYEDMEASLFDLEGDGDLDLYVVSGGNEYAQSSSLYADRIYENDGQGNLKRLDMDALAKNPQSGRSVAAIDFDQDNDQDLLVGNRIIPQNYPRFSPSVLYENRDGVLIDVTNERAPDLKEFGIVNKVISTDFDNDGLTDFIAVGEWTAIGLFRNTGGQFERLKDTEGVPEDKGWWFDVKETDVNNDGLKDYVIGNVGLNIKFKSSKEKPFKVFATDFDENGTNDIVLTKKYHDTYVPVRGRECSSQQMPFIKDKFPTYSEFANASLNDIYGEKLSTSYSSEATEFNSILLLNKGDGNFEKIVLPIEAQIFPVLDILAIDINGDEYEDLILSGNIYETEVETPRLDAISGLVLLSNHENNYNPLPYWQSGLYLSGNVKSADIVKTGQQLLMVHTVNNGAVGVHEINTGAY